MTVIGRAQDADRFVDRLKRREKPARPNKAKAKTTKAAKPKAKR